MDHVLHQQIITASVSDLECPDSVLRRKSSVVESIDDDVQLIVATMSRVLLDSPHGTGISAIQIGIPLRIVVLNHTRALGNEIVLINPIALQISGRMVTRKEGCLSLPNYHADVTRRNKIRVKALNLVGDEFIYATSGYEATVLQHELNHLDGILYWDITDNKGGLQRRPLQE
jgi:peptide deformylase